MKNLIQTNLGYDKNKLIEQVKDITSFKTSRDFFQVLLDHIKEDKLNKHIPLDFSSSIDLDKGILHKDRVGIFFNGSWEEKVSSICTFAKSLGFVINEPIMKIITPQSFFKDVLFGIEFSNKQYPERIKIYLILEQDYKNKFKNKEVINFLFEHLNFNIGDIVNPGDKLNSFSLDLYKSGDIVLKIYINSLENSHSIFDQFSKKTKSKTIQPILDIVKEKVIIEARDIVMGCYKISKDCYSNELKRIDAPLRGNEKIVEKIMEKIDFKDKLTLFNNPIFSFVSIDLKNKITFYYGPNHYVNYIKYA